MPKKAKSKIKIKTEKKTIWDIFKFGESYTSLILGIVVVIIATILLLTFVKGKNTSIKSEIADNTKQEQKTSTTIQTQNLLTSEQKNPTITQAKNVISSSTHTVVAGDTLWSIAEKKYNSGYNWVDIQKANNLTNPNVLFAGTKLTLPNIEPKIATQSRASIQTNKISGSSYTIVRGDTLWDIAVRAYGDGYAWTKISSANNLPNPDLIHSGNKLSIPRG